MDHLTLALLVGGAFIVGVAKTSIGGLAALPVMMLAFAMPTKESTGAVLLLYLAGDVVAVWRYRASVGWSLLIELVPWVIPGLALGAWFLSVADPDSLRRWIGALLAVSVVLHLVLAWRGSRIEEVAPREGVGRAAGAAVAGVAAGFTTMAANTGGPVMTLYLLATKVDKLTFLGTAAWFFLTINLVKVPFSISVGAITSEVVLLVAPLVPVVWTGCALGIWVLKRLPQRAFDSLTLLSTAVAAVLLVLR